DVVAPAHPRDLRLQFLQPRAAELARDGDVHAPDADIRADDLRHAMQVRAGLARGPLDEIADIQRPHQAARPVDHVRHQVYRSLKPGMFFRSMGRKLRSYSCRACAKVMASSSCVTPGAMLMLGENDTPPPTCWPRVWSITVSFGCRIAGKPP